MTELEQIPVTALLPQQPPFIMIDALTDFSEKETATRLTVRKDNIFVERGLLTAYGMLENMAQTCAARLGYANYVLHKAVNVGFIGAVRGGVFHRLPQVGEEIATGRSVQVFLNEKRELLWSAPEFYESWKKKWNVNG